MSDERELHVARGRVQVLQSGCRQIVESIGVKRDGLDRLPVDTSEVDDALDRAATALLEAIDELVVVDRELQRLVPS